MRVNWTGKYYHANDEDVILFVLKSVDESHESHMAFEMKFNWYETILSVCSFDTQVRA